MLPQALEPSAAQLSAATLALINTLIARQGHARGLVKLAQRFSFARWGLEGYVIAESNRLTARRLLGRLGPACAARVPWGGWHAAAGTETPEPTPDCAAPSALPPRRACGYWRAAPTCRGWSTTCADSASACPLWPAWASCLGAAAGGLGAGGWADRPGTLASPLRLGVQPHHTLLLLLALL